MEILFGVAVVVLLALILSEMQNMRVWIDTVNARLENLPHSVYPADVEYSIPRNSLPPEFVETADLKLKAQDPSDVDSSDIIAEYVAESPVWDDVTDLPDMSAEVVDVQPARHESIATIEQMIEDELEAADPVHAPKSFVPDAEW